MARVVLAVAVPVWVASAFLLYNVRTDTRELIDRDAAATARALMVAVDRELASAKATALALATSPSLMADDFGTFYAQATEVLRSGAGSNVVLTNASGQQVLNTLRHPGDPLPRHGDPELVRKVFSSAKPAISDLFTGGVRQRPVASIDVPVIRDGGVVYDLSIGFFPDRLGEMLREEALPPGWVASIFDSRGVIVARTQAAEQFVGHMGATLLVQRMAKAPEGIVETSTLEGIPVSAAFSRSHVSGWTVAIGVPTRELTTRLWRSLAWSCVSTLVLAAFSFIAAHFAGQRLIRPIRELGRRALALGQGNDVAIAPLGLKEADELAGVLVETSRLIEARTAERDRAQAQQRQTLVAKQLAEQAAQARSTWFAYLAHELRTPLTAILGCSELMARRVHAQKMDEKFLDYCERIGTGVDHLMSIISEILDYARYEAQQIELNLESLDVSTEVRGAADILEGRAAQAGVTLRCDVADNLPPLQADRIRLRQILLNLLSNALRFTPAGGSVRVTVTAPQVGKLMIRIKDTGIGISPDDLPRILEPFAQVRSAQESKRSGTGLGLPLTKGLVELHGGTFGMASTPGAGTVVTLWLPAVPGPSDSPPGAICGAPANRGAALSRAAWSDGGHREPTGGSCRR